jgi:hypothetical protein
VHHQGAERRQQFDDAGEGGAREAIVEREHALARRPVDALPELHREGGVAVRKQPDRGCGTRFGHAVRTLAARGRQWF